MKTYLTAIFVFLTASLPAQKTSEEERIKEVQKRYDQAIEQKDSTTLHSLFHSKMIVTGGDGTRRDAQAEIRDSTDPNYSVAYFKTSNIEVDVFDQTAVLRGDLEWQIRMGENQPRTLSRRITFTYARLNGQWKIVAQHIGPSPKKP